MNVKLDYYLQYHFFYNILFYHWSVSSTIKKQTAITNVIRNPTNCSVKWEGLEMVTKSK